MGSRGPEIIPLPGTISASPRRCCSTSASAAFRLPETMSADSAIRQGRSCLRDGLRLEPSILSIAITPRRARYRTKSGSTARSREAIPAFRRYVETRYRLLPYVYTLADEASRTGIPIMRPVFLEFPEVLAPSSSGFDGLNTEFLLGSSLLIAPPPFAETLDDYTVSFPKGQWYDFWTGLKTATSPPTPSIVDIVNGTPGSGGPATAKIHPVLETLPVYVRGGSIVPLQPLVQSTDETPGGPLELRVYPGQECAGSLYLDDGHTFRYQHGEFLRQKFTCKADGNSVRVDFGARQGPAHAVVGRPLRL